MECSWEPETTHNSQKPRMCNEFKCLSSSRQQSEEMRETTTQKKRVKFLSLLKISGKVVFFSTYHHHERESDRSPNQIKSSMSQTQRSARRVHMKSFLTFLHAKSLKRLEFNLNVASGVLRNLHTHDGLTDGFAWAAIFSEARQTTVNSQEIQYSTFANLFSLMSESSRRRKQKDANWKKTFVLLRFIWGCQEINIFLQYENISKWLIIIFALPFLFDV